MADLVAESMDSPDEDFALTFAILRNSGVEGWHNTCGKDSWGFTCGLPNLSDGKCENTESYLSELERSSTFACPDSIAAMLRAYDLPADILQGSVTKRDHGAEKGKVLEDARGRLKADIQLAWSQEAVERGVEHARDEEFGSARQCYKQALEIFPDNVDALVALGAAYANQKNFKEALSCFSKALVLRPEDANALKYKEAVEQRLESVAQPARSSKKDHAGGSSRAMRSASAECLRGDSAEGAGEQPPPAANIPTLKPTPMAMDTQEALQIVSTHYERESSSDTASPEAKKKRRHKEKKKKKRAHKQKKKRRKL